MKSANATELYIAMHNAVTMEQWPRQVSDPESCQTSQTWEARPGWTFELCYPTYNVQTCVPMDKKWALANTLHFFSGSEEAEMLGTYNKHADRFLKDGRWLGAYGAIAMPQVYECVKRLREHPASRRAVVSMGGYAPQDINRPACWSFLQFLQDRNGLCLLVYQRSLNLTKIMPYDLVVLSNLLLFVAHNVGQPASSLVWTVGSLHTTNLTGPNHLGSTRHQSIVLPVPPDKCLQVLRDPSHEVWCA